MAQPRFVKLTTSDAPDEFITVDVAVANMSKTIRDMLEDFGDALDVPVPLHNVSAKILRMVIAFCEQHVADPAPAAPADVPKDTVKRPELVISAWDRDFCAVDQKTLFELILAANYLDVKPLLDVACKTVANLIKGRTPEEIRKTFNIKNDFTPEEEEKVRQENEWCEEK